jgi:large subunit ribosomal protein L19
MGRSILDHVESKHVRKDVTEFRTGDTVRVHWKVKEGDKERVQPFEGVVIRKTKGHNRATFTVRKVSYGIGVERIFPLHSPRYEKIEVLTHGNVHRSRLFFLRNLKGKASRVEAQGDRFEEAPAEVAAQASGTVDEEATAPAAESGTDAVTEQPPASTAEKKKSKKARAGAAAEK